MENISPEEQIVGAPLLGKVISYDPKASEIELVLEEPLSIGDGLRIKGRLTDLTQRVERLYVGSRSSQSALPGEKIRLAVADRVRSGDAAYKVRVT